MLDSIARTAGTTADTSWRALLIPTNPGEFWSLVVAVVAIFGLLSLWLVKKDIRNRTTREAAQTTIDRCNEMCLVLIPAFLGLLKDTAAQKVTTFISDPANVSFEASDEARQITAAFDWLQRVPQPTRDKAVALMNRLEVWSMSFTHDPALADQRVAFEPCSAAFCQMVMWLYPMLLVQRQLGAPRESGPFQNIVMLFRGWYRQQAHGRLLEQLVRLESGGSLPKPIS